MQSVTDFIVALTCFLTLPALLAIIAQMHVYRLEDDTTKTPYIRWILSNPVGVVLIPLTTFVLILLRQANWNIVAAFTTPGMSGNVVLPIVFTGLLAVSNVVYRGDQEKSEMRIIQKLEAKWEARRKEEEARRKEEEARRDKAFEKLLTQIDALRQGATEIEKEQAYQRGLLDGQKLNRS